MLVNNNLAEEEKEKKRMERYRDEGQLAVMEHLAQGGLKVRTSETKLCRFASAWWGCC